jgi:deoxyribonuclease-4
MLLGSHLSIAGGLERALTRAHEYGFGALAMFVRNQRQWSARPLGDQTVKTFRRMRRRLKIGPVLAHGSYLVNLAGEEPVRRRSIVATAEELDRCGRLGIDALVIHPGSCPDRRVGIARIAEALNQIMAACPHRRPRILLETTAGAGHTLGGTFEELAAILELLETGHRFGVCLDTCHVFAAGYDLHTPRAYRRTLEEFDRIIGLDRLHAVHLNDCLGHLGSRLDRHAHIGRGRIGRQGFCNFVNDPRLATIPGLLETPKGLDKRGRAWDLINANVLRSLVRVGGRRPGQEGKT